MDNYLYPRVIEFIDSITNVVLILFVPSLMLLVGYLTYVTFVFAKKDNRIINISLSFLLIVGIVVYFYYTFFVLDYLDLLKNALLSLILTLLYIIIFPLVLMYIIFTSTDIEKSLFLNSDLIIKDIKTWLDAKFYIDISNATKESFIVMFKLLTLLIFSSKIINVTRFIISSFTSKDSKKDFIMALVVFGVFFLLYLFLNQKELLIIAGFISNSISVMFSGGMR